MLGRPALAPVRLGAGYLVRRHRVGHVEQQLRGPALGHEDVVVVELDPIVLARLRAEFSSGGGWRNETSTSSAPTSSATRLQV